MKTTAIIQARMGSTRLPGKVIKLLGFRTVLGQVITRVKACPLVDEVVVATTVLLQDDAIEKESRKYSVRVFRGSEEDVLARYHGAAQEADAQIVVRVTADCPLFDPQVLAAMLEQFLDTKCPGPAPDYLSNTLERTFPRGLDAEIFTRAALERAHREADKPFQREHVTPYIYQHPEFFLLKNFLNAMDLSAHRWTLDTPEDYLLLESIFASLDRGPELFTTQAVLDLLESRPELVALNAHVEQKQL